MIDENIMYIDPKAIDSFYMQLLSIRENQNNLDDIKTNFDNVFTSLTDSPYIVKNIESMIAKLYEVIDLLRTTNLLYDTIENAEACSSQTKRFFLATSLFNLPQISNPGLISSKIEDIARDGNIIFNIETNNAVDYTMTAGIHKFFRSPEGIVPPSPDLQYFCSYKGRFVPLKIFGFTLKIKEYAFYIKPIAIWENH